MIIFHHCSVMEENAPGQEKAESTSVVKIIRELGPWNAAVIPIVQAVYCLSKGTFEWKPLLSTVVFVLAVAFFYQIYNLSHGKRTETTSGLLAASVQFSLGAILTLWILGMPHYPRDSFVIGVAKLEEVTSPANPSQIVRSQLRSTLPTDVNGIVVPISKYVTAEDEARRVISANNLDMLLWGDYVRDGGAVYYRTHIYNRNDDFGVGRVSAGDTPDGDAKPFGIQMAFAERASCLVAIHSAAVLNEKGQRSEALSLLDQTLEGFTVGKKDSLCRTWIFHTQGQLLYFDRDYSGALEKMLAFFGMHPLVGNRKAALITAHSAFKTDKFETAANYYAYANNVKEGPQALNGLAASLRELGLLDKAIFLAKKSLDLYGDQLNVQAALAEMHRQRFLETSNASDLDSSFVYVGKCFNNTVVDSEAAELRLDCVALHARNLASEGRKCQAILWMRRASQKTEDSTFRSATLNWIEQHSASAGCR